MTDHPGIIISYTGDGKGKTTAALGMVFRALGVGHQVRVIQFIKGKWLTGERRFAENIPNLEFHVMGKGFTWESDNISDDKKRALAAWELAKTFLGDSTIDLLILDEISYVLNYGFLDPNEFLDVLASRPSAQTVVLTGRNMPPSVLEYSDLVTEMKKLKHPFDRGMKAIKGVDF